MAFVNPLDKVPQVPQAWANHIIWGAVLGAAFAFMADSADIPDPLAFGAAAALIIAIIKKSVDFIETDESAAECIGKAVVTAIWPATLALVATQ